MSSWTTLWCANAGAIVPFATMRYEIPYIFIVAELDYNQSVSEQGCCLLDRWRTGVQVLLHHKLGGRRMCGCPEGRVAEALL